MSPCRTALLLLALLPGLPLAEAQTESIQPPPVTRGPVDLERELQAPWQAGGEILPGSASDAMLPLDTVTSQPPLAPRQDSGPGGTTASEAPEADASAASPEVVAEPAKPAE